MQLPQVIKTDIINMIIFSEADMFKTETHIHTAEVSPCSHIRAVAMVRKYASEGYSTVCITDHFQGNTLDALGDIPWADKMAIFLAGYYRAKREGDKLGINVIMGAEFCFSDSSNHFVAYGISKAFLDAYPELHKMTVKEFSVIAKEHGVFLVQAHPYRDGKCFPMTEYVDAIELYNSNPRHDNKTELAETLVKEIDIPVSAGSDTHRDEDVALSGIMTETEIKTAEDLIDCIKNRKVKLIRGVQAK